MTPDQLKKPKSIHNRLVSWHQRLIHNDFDIGSRIRLSTRGKPSGTVEDGVHLIYSPEVRNNACIAPVMTHRIHFSVMEYMTLDILTGLPGLREREWIGETETNGPLMITERLG